MMQRSSSRSLLLSHSLQVCNCYACSYVKVANFFSRFTEAEQAKQFLDGRWFGGRVIKADIYDQGKFLANELSH